MIETKQVTLVSLMDVVEAAGEEKGGDQPIWAEVLNRQHGNQIFTDSTVFIYWFPSLNGDPLSEVQQRIWDLCEEWIIEDQIYFEVDW